MESAWAKGTPEKQYSYLKELIWFFSIIFIATDKTMKMFPLKKLLKFLESFPTNKNF